MHVLVSLRLRPHTLSLPVPALRSSSRYTTLTSSHTCVTSTLTLSGLVHVVLLISMYGLFATFASAAILAHHVVVAIPMEKAPLFQRANIQPIMDGQNFPDPSVIRMSDGWHAFSTNARIDGKLIHVQMAYTPDWKTWTFKSGVDALPKLPSWVDTVSPRVWAPDVVQHRDGSFVMYYTAASKSDTRLHCVSYATSKNVDGPYVDDSTSPWICPAAEGGAIDPAGYSDSDGTRWVVYKIDGNAIGHGGICGNTVAPIVSTPIMLQQVNADDGHTLVGKLTQLITNGPNDGPVVEAPSLSFLDGKYVLFFSSNCYATTLYDVSYATAPNITGPYDKFGPLFVTGTDGLTAPGGLDLAVNGNHAMWHGYMNVTDNPEECISKRHGKTADCDRTREFGPGRAAFTATLSQADNVVKATF